MARAGFEPSDLLLGLPGYAAPDQKAGLRPTPSDGSDTGLLGCRGRSPRPRSPMAGRTPLGGDDTHRRGGHSRTHGKTSAPGTPIGTIRATWHERRRCRTVRAARRWSGLAAPLAAQPSGMLGRHRCACYHFSGRHTSGTSRIAADPEPSLAGSGCSMRLRSSCRRTARDPSRWLHVRTGDRNSCRYRRRGAGSHCTSNIPAARRDSRWGRRGRPNSSTAQ
jgi:hypothetical protein